MQKNSAIRLTFLGAAQTVTGSKYLVEFDNKKVLFDCGIFQGKKELRLKNWEKPPIDPSELDAIVLTHAHIDHTGYLPVMARDGFRGPVYCTPATKDFLSLLLLDSAHLQEEEARYANEKGSSKHHPALPLYDRSAAEAALQLLRAIPRDRATPILPGISVTPTCSGHILGATSLSVDINGRRITFSGDVGRYGAPILPDPQPLALGDLLLCESTYGDRDHPTESSKDSLRDALKRALARNGPVIIPAFALGRTQDLLYNISQLERDGEIPVVPVYVDSPMAVDSTNIYRRYHHDYDEDAAALLALGETPLHTERTTFCQTTDQSKRLNTLSGPRIVISASGMVTGGRILHHMANWLPVENTTVLFVGFQAEGTRGRLILSGEKEIKIFGRMIPIRAHVEEIAGLSAHGDRNELLRWLKSCQGSPSIVRVVHGEPAPSRAFSELLRRELQWEAQPANFLETVELS